MGDYDDLEHGTLIPFSQAHPPVEHDEHVDIGYTVTIKDEPEAGAFKVESFHGDFASLVSCPHGDKVRAVRRGRLSLCVVVG
jgi:hypothetical protein